MITLSGAMTSAIGVTYPRHGAFVEIGFTTPLRVHDRQGTKTWDSKTWVAADVRIGGFVVENGAAQRCSITFVDSDNAIAQQLRAQKIGLPVKVWLFDASALAAGDPIKLFDGIIAAASGGDDRRVRVDCSLVDVWLPRGMLANIVPAYMFMPEGSVVQFGDGTIIAQRRSEYA